MSYGMMVFLITILYFKTDRLSDILYNASPQFGWVYYLGMDIFPYIFYSGIAALLLAIIYIRFLMRNTNWRIILSILLVLCSIIQLLLPGLLIPREF